MLLLGTTRLLVFNNFSCQYVYSELIFYWMLRTNLILSIWIALSQTLHQFSYLSFKDFIPQHTFMLYLTDFTPQHVYLISHFALPTCLFHPTCLLENTFLPLQHCYSIREHRKWDGQTAGSKNWKTPFFSRYSKFLSMGDWNWSKNAPVFFVLKNLNKYGR